MYTQHQSCLHLHHVNVQCLAPLANKLHFYRLFYRSFCYSLFSIEVCRNYIELFRIFLFRILRIALYRILYRKYIFSKIVC